MIPHPASLGTEITKTIRVTGCCERPLQVWKIRGDQKVRCYHYANLAASLDVDLKGSVFLTSGHGFRIVSLAYALNSLAHSSKPCLLLAGCILANLPTVC